MKLTGKALQDFDQYVRRKYDDYVIEEDYNTFGVARRRITLWNIHRKLPAAALNGLIVEWLDSVGVVIENRVVGPDVVGDPDVDKAFSAEVDLGLVRWDDENLYSSRQAALEAAIEKAGELYNKTQ